MHKFPTNKAPSCAVDEYIGSDFDAVQAVADNIETIKGLGDAADGLADVVENLDELLKLANNLEAFQITEFKQLNYGQQDVVFEKVLPFAMSLYVHGPFVDRGMLFKDLDYDISSNNSIRLKRTYGAKTTLEAVQAITAETTGQVIYADRTVFNRPIVPFQIGAILKDSVQWGEVTPPILVYNTAQYIPDKPLTIEYKINSDVVKEIGEGVIEVSTDHGPVILDAKPARALTESQITATYRESILGLLTTKPLPWKAFTEITNVTHRIIVDGLEYVPVKVPFTTKGSWLVDKANWLLVQGILPANAVPEGVSINTQGEYAVKVSAPEPVNVVSIIGTPKYHKILLIPTDSNITLLHSNSRIRLESGNTLRLTPNCVYEFYVDHEGIVRQVR